MFPDDHHRLLSRPIKIIWDGWESDTYRLQQGGWEFSAEQMIERMSVRLAMRNSRCRMYGFTNMVPVDFFELASNSAAYSAVVFHVAHMASQLTIQTVEVQPLSYSPVDMMPQMMTGERKSIEDFGIFATPLVRTNEIILPEASVGELLDTILKKQAPDQKAYYEEKVRDARKLGRTMGAMEAVPQQKFHAQIISLAEAA